jgi:predicted Zn-dependent protease with MMP-like domain
MDTAAFERAVSEALDLLPRDIAALMDNVAVFVEDVPPADVAPDTLGLYEGTPLTERGEGWSGSLPDRITIFRRPILAICDDEDEVKDEALVTVVHEIAHHFGIDDERLHELGWD